MAIKYALIIVGIFLCSCVHTAGDKGVMAGPPVVIADSSKQMLAEPPTLTSFEMRDDSVFNDGSIPVKWENAGFTDVKGFKLFLKQAQVWIMENDKAALATIIRYPLKNINSPEELIRSYDAVFTKPVKLSFATINFSQIFRNSQGAMTEGGRVWFLQSGDSFKIIAINN